MRYYRIGDYLRWEFLEKFEVNQNQLAAAIKVEQNRISEIVRNRRRVTPNTDLRLCRYFGCKNGHFLEVQMGMEIREELEKIGKELEEIIPYKELKQR